MQRTAASRNVSDHYESFAQQVAVIKEKNQESNAASEKEQIDLLAIKQANAINGLETSTFTVCCRIRPILPFDEAGSEDKFECIFQDKANSFSTGPPAPPAPPTPSADDYTESALLLNPKVTLQGKTKLEPVKFKFDYAFGPDDQNDYLFEKVGKPIISKAVAGQIGVIFAYGQTGSGKTHTMNGIMDNVVKEIYDSGVATTHTISFSYLQIAGQVCTDCLDANAVEGAVKIGEFLDGRVEMRNLTEITCANAQEFVECVESAKKHRSTESTERNASSSRSHGVGIIHIAAICTEAERSAGIPQPTAGALYIIDLAGSERMADSRNHTDKRMEETKAINLSLMSLKECIRARTVAGAGDGRVGCNDAFVPYRRSKLTLLMKDVFDIGCKRLCSTVVLAHVSPLARDVKHSSNTLQYAAPLRVSVQKTKNHGKKYQRDTRDPALWTRDELAAWVTVTSPSTRVTVSNLVAENEGGLALCMLPEPEMFRRVAAAFNGEANNDANVVAKTLYSALWTLICDAKVRKRRPDGSIITEEDEAKVKVEAEKALAAKAKLWAEREAHMKSDLVGYDGKPIQ